MPDHLAENSKDDLVEMIQHGASLIMNSNELDNKRNTDIDDIIRAGEEKTAALNAKYAELKFDDLANFKSESTVAGSGWADGKVFQIQISFPNIC